jgi:hypothetical protein
MEPGSEPVVGVQYRFARPVFGRKFTMLEVSSVVLLVNHTPVILPCGLKTIP